ncbi:MAG TPA: hypothetical protein VFS21_23405 [Roseiflexaceae bacterium]|nr:hypothetical protein [Roseiflexaceae bacterium]
MTSTVIGIFDDSIAARRALEALHDGPLALDDISIITRDTQSGRPVDNDEDISAGEGLAVGAAWGALVGGVASFLIPGLGPFLAGGALFAALTGAAAGAVVGGITAALANFSNIPESEARDLEQMVHEGKTLVAVRVVDEHTAEVRRVMAEQGAAELHEQDHPQGQRVRVLSYNAGGDRVHDTHSEGDQWSGGGMVADGEGGPRDTGRYDAHQWVGEGQGQGPQKHPGEHWSGGEVVGEGQGRGPRDTGAEHGGQWAGKGQGEPPATRTISDPPNEPPRTERDPRDPERWSHAEQDQRPVSHTDDPSDRRLRDIPEDDLRIRRPTDFK